LITIKPFLKLFLWTDELSKKNSIMVVISLTKTVLTDPSPNRTPWSWEFYNSCVWGIALGLLAALLSSSTSPIAQWGIRDELLDKSAA